MNKRTTKRALLMSALSLLLCVSMLVGSTFAWFTDSVTSAGNKIQAGTLKIDLELLDKATGEWTSIKESEQALFNYDLWEPGYTEVKVLKIENEGSLALKWVAQLQSEYKLSALADVIDVYVNTAATAYPTDRALEGYTKVGTVAEFVNTIAQTTNGYLLAEEEAYLGIALKMQESAGNEYQGLDLGGSFDIKIFATQYTYEKDSFDEMYDEKTTVADLADMKAALAEGATAFDFAGNELKLSYGLTKAMVPAGKTITISNAYVTGKNYGNAVDGTVIFENCTFTNTGAYSIHFDAGNGDVIFKNCELYGWNSFGASLNSVSLIDCALYGNGTYGLIRSYADLYVENCYIDTTKANHSDNYPEGIEAVGGATLTEKHNTYVASTLTEVMALAKKGDTVIDCKGANLGDYSYDGTFANGTVLKNATFTYVYGASVDGLATFENCKFVSDHSYSANFSDGSYTGKVVFNNCYFDGWNSFGTAITGVEMNNCVFETVIGPYSLLRFYQDAVLNNCEIKASFDGIDTNQAGTVVQLNNCIGIEGKIYNNTDGGVVKVGTWIVDGVELTNVPAW